MFLFIYCNCVYDVENNNELIGVYPTVECKKVFQIGYDTLIRVLDEGSVYKGKLFRRKPLDT